MTLSSAKNYTTFDANVPLCKLKTAESAFCFSAPIVWNELSEQVRTSATCDSFSGKDWVVCKL